MSTCTSCTAPAGDVYKLCGNCGDEIARDLAFVPALLAELEVTYAKQDKLTVTPGRGGDEGLPWKEQAHRAAVEIGDCLRRWATGLPVSAAEIPADPADLSRWLHSRVDWLRALEHAKNAHQDITGAVTRAIAVIDLPANRARFEVGPCPEQVEQGACDGTVWAYIATRSDDMSMLRCWTCGARWNTTQWLRVGRRILARAHQLARHRAA